VPDGFDPHVELQTIYSVREMMIECRKDTMTVIQMYRDELARLRADPNASTADKVLLGETILSRGHGKPRQQVSLSLDAPGEGQVKFYIPENGRDDLEPTTIEAEPT
jgi:hypothetical protein